MFKYLGIALSVVSLAKGDVNRVLRRIGIPGIWEIDCGLWTTYYSPITGTVLTASFDLSSRHMWNITATAINAKPT